LSRSRTEMDMGDKQPSAREQSSSLVELKIRIPQDLYVAYQRCSWVIVHETGRQPLTVMEEMVRDFLVKHGC